MEDSIPVLILHTGSGSEAYADLNALICAIENELSGWESCGSGSMLEVEVGEITKWEYRDAFGDLP